MTKAGKQKAAVAVLVLLALLWWYLTRAKVAIESETVLPDEQVGTPGASIPIAEAPTATPWPWEAPQTQAQIDAGLAAAAVNPVAAPAEPQVDYQGILDERTKQIQAAIAATAAQEAYVAAHPYIG